MILKILISLKNLYEKKESSFLNNFVSLAISLYSFFTLISFFGHF